MQAFSFSAPRFTEQDEIRELAAMTDAEREEVKNDLYGTHVEIEETQELRERSLQQVQHCLEDMPETEKQVYLEACQVCPKLVNTESAPIRFLRSENYQAEVRVRVLLLQFLSMQCCSYSCAHSHFRHSVESCKPPGQVLGLSETSLWGSSLFENSIG